MKRPPRRHRTLKLGPRHFGFSRTESEKRREHLATFVALQLLNQAMSGSIRGRGVKGVYLGAGIGTLSLVALGDSGFGLDDKA